MNYFDKMQQLGNLTIVNGCHAQVPNPRTGMIEESVFLIGRSKSHPPVYYLRCATLDNEYRTALDLVENPDGEWGRASAIRKWTPWEKIDLNIPVDHALPLHIDNHLYMLWAEKATVSGVEDDKGQSRSQVVATVKFSYQQASGKWLQPQVFAKDMPRMFLLPLWKGWNIAPRGETQFVPKALLERTRHLFLIWADQSPVLVARGQRQLANTLLTNVQALLRQALSHKQDDAAEPSREHDDAAKPSRKDDEAKRKALHVARQRVPVISPQVEPAQHQLDSVLPYLLTSFVPNHFNEQAKELFNDVTTLALVEPQMTDAVAATPWLAVEGLAVVGDTTWLGLRTKESTETPTYRIHRVTTRCFDDLRQILIHGGLKELLSLASQFTLESPIEAQHPTKFVERPYPPKTMDFELSSAYGMYFQEVFFHIPFLIARTLQIRQRFEEAKRWYESIFDPTSSFEAPNPERLIGGWQLSKASYDQPTGFQPSEPSGDMSPARPQDPSNVRFVECVTPFAGRIQTLHFDGNHDKLDAQLSKAPAHGFTFAAWIWLDDLDGNYTVFSLPNGYFLFYENQSGLRFEFGPSVSGETKRYFGIPEDGGAPVPLSAQRWYHVAVTFGGVGDRMRIYVDGAPAAATNPLNDVPSPGRTLTFGAWDGSSRLFKGRIAEAFVWDVGLSVQQVHATMKGDFFWQYRPFRSHTAAKLAEVIQRPAQREAMELTPLDPFAVARTRLGAYEKAVAMAYIDNLIAWGDSLYANDGWENLNAATTLYVLAAELLGPKPVGKISYSEQNGKLTVKAASTAVHEPGEQLATILGNAVNSDWASNPFFDVPSSFFLPENDQFAARWDTVEKRLYQIRHCMNLQGVVRQLPLFQPPIDPRQLMRAVAAGRSVAAVTPGATVNVPHYRFSFLMERARLVTSELKQLGTTLLGALEKQDAEHLAVLRNTYEGQVLELTTRIKEQQRDELEKNLVGLRQSLASARKRESEYQHWASQRLSPGEIAGLSLTQTAGSLRTAASVITALSGIGYAAPNIFGLADGGMDFGKVVQVGGEALNLDATILEWGGQLAMTRAQYDRRQEEWQLQADTAGFEVQQIQAQIDALEVRQEMTRQELTIHRQTVKQNQDIERIFQQRFTSQELYQWMVGRLASLYSQTYQMALDLARSTQSAFQYERNTNDTFVNANGWNSLKKGLLAGEALSLNLNQMEKAYIERNARQLEIEKTISLRQLDPKALVDLKGNGSCTFALSEVLFDLDFPGHYLRKIKSVSLSIPAVVGPYQTLQATLIQHGNQVVLTPDVDTVKMLLGEATGNNRPDASKLRTDWQAAQQIALSRGVNDAGLFELNFHDERYLPFEGTGAISTWELRMPKSSNQIDYASISDVIITLRYTARDGGDAFRQALLSTNTLKKLSGYRVLTARQLDAAAWQVFRSRPQEGLKLTLARAMFPPNLSRLALVGNKISLHPWPQHVENAPRFSAAVGASPHGAAPSGDPGATRFPAGAGGNPGIPVTIRATGDQLQQALAKIDDLLLVVPFQGDLNWGQLSHGAAGVTE